MVWAKNGTPNTLTVAGDLLTITDLTGVKFNQFLVHKLQDGTSNAHGQINFNNDTSTNYAVRQSVNGGADSTAVSGGVLDIWQGYKDEFYVINVINISTEEKLFIGHVMEKNTTGAGNAPIRSEYIAKWANTSDAITEIDVTNNGTGDYAIDSNISAHGTD